MGPLIGMAPQLRDVDRDAVEQVVELLGVAAQAGQGVSELGDAQAAPVGAQAALHLRALVLAEVDAADLTQAHAEADVVVNRREL